MPKIGQEKIKKIKENILALLFEKMPHALFTSNIASELARDEEFIKSIMLELEKEGLVKRIDNHFLRKIQWSLSDKVYLTYKNLKGQDSEGKGKQASKEANEISAEISNVQEEKEGGKQDEAKIIDEQDKEKGKEDKEKAETK